MPSKTLAAGLVAAVALTAGCAGETLGGTDAAPGEPDARAAPDARAFPDAFTFPDAPLGFPDASTADAPRQVDAATTPDAAPGSDAGPLSCITGPGVTQVTTSTVYLGENYAGATNQYVFNSNQCSDPPDSVERIYSFELAAPTEWYAETRCGTTSGWDCELVLTRNGCTDAQVVGCKTTIGDETMSGTLQAGKYALFIEGDNPDDPAIYDLMINFNHTGGLAQCAATPLDVLKAANCEDPILDYPNYHLALANQSTSPADVDDFFVDGVDGCTHDQDHVGGAPDKVYTLTLPAARDVKISVTSPDWDALLYVTGAPCGARSSVVACSDDLIGSTEEISTHLAAGTWYIVVDGFGPKTFDARSWGAFSLDVKVYDNACNQ